jgi:hypothetical protein
VAAVPVAKAPCRRHACLDISTTWYGRERGVGRPLGVGVTRDTGVGVEVGVAIGVRVGIGVGVGLGVTGIIAPA